MAINIGSGNILQGNINIGDNAKQIAKDFNQEFNSIDKILDLLRIEISEKYKEEDKDYILNNYDEFKDEIKKPEEHRDKDKIKNKLSILNKALSVMSDISGVASFILAIYQAFN